MDRSLGTYSTHSDPLSRLAWSILSEMAYRTFGPLFFIRPTALREARSVRHTSIVPYLFLLTICLSRNPDTDDRPTGLHPMSGCSRCLALPEKLRSPSLTRVTTHPMAGLFLGATPVISKASPQRPPAPDTQPYQFCSSDPGRPETSHQLQDRHTYETQLAMNVSGLSQTPRAVRTGSDHPRKSD
jgi:hypothetical protein